MRSLIFFANEATASLRRGWRSSLLALSTIATAVFVLATFLLLSVTVRATLDRWSQAAGLSVYLRDGATAAEREDIARALGRSELTVTQKYVSRDEARAEFVATFPELAAAIQSIQPSPLPASFEVTLDARRGTKEAFDRLVTSLRRLPGVSDVRYDAGLLERLRWVVAIGERVAYGLSAMLLLAAALSVVSVVRLSYVARREEIGILLLVGAPHAAIRGPFVVEGLLQGMLGAAIALLLLSVAFVTVNARSGATLSAALGVERLPFLSAAACVGLVAGSGLLGALAGYAAVSGRALNAD